MGSIDTNTIRRRKHTNFENNNKMKITRKELLTVPNIITLSRIPLIILLLFALSTKWRYPLFLLIVFTDGIDGWAARRLDQTSEFGAVLDPAIDKITALVLFFALFPRVDLGWSYAFLFFLRDIFILGLTPVIIYKVSLDRDEIKARKLGKVVTNLQFFAMLAFLIPRRDISLIILGLLGIFSTLAIIDYALFIWKKS